VKREDGIAALDGGHWDFVIVGGGATGLGVAIDAASRGYRTLLLEQSDLGKGTSSRSTKLVHGGVRYLQQGNLALVLEALKERGLLRANAPHLVRNLSFVVPNYEWWEGPFYGIGLKLYDLLAGRHGFGRSRFLSRDRTLQLLPTIEPAGLVGGVIYYDGQFDDARLCIALARTAAAHGAVLVNYARVTGLVKRDGAVVGVRVRDLEAAPGPDAGQPAGDGRERNGAEREVSAGVVVNATGPWTDEVRRMDDPGAGRLVRHSQGAHLVLPRDFLPGESAIMVPRTDDHRVLFAIPWLDRVLVGTTDTPVPEASLDPVALDGEVDFLLEHAGRYLDRDPTRADVLSVFAGLRPLVGGDDDVATASLSRDHTLIISDAGLVTITGGKWTTYRRMAEDTVDQAATLAGLEDRPCVTRDLRLHGYHRQAHRFGELAPYGSDAPELRDLLSRDPRYARPLHPSLQVRAGEVVWAVRHELARTVEDFLARRSRALLLDARAAVEAAPAVADLMAEGLGRDDAWARDQVDRFARLAQDYLP
jgi:glycerol-3-phosphate dehydrogenase